jgi:hypothetical protein
MGESVEAEAQPVSRLEAVSACLHHLLGFRAALACFGDSLQTLGDKVQDPMGRRHLLALWRPCQERLDLLLEAVVQCGSWSSRLTTLRHEVEDTLIDEAYNPAALIDLAAAFEQACEGLLIQVEMDLRQTVAGLDEVSE